MQKISNGLILIVLLSVLSACGGLGKSVYKIESQAITKNTALEKLDRRVVLKLSRSLCGLKWYVGIGLPYYADLGEAFCVNATDMANHLFEDVTVFQTGQMNSPDTLMLTPELIQVQKRSAIKSYEATWIRIFVRWTFTDSKGEVVWQDIIDGKGEGTMGGPISYKNNSREQFRLALSDMFSNTMQTMRVSAGFLTSDPSADPYRNHYFDWIQAKHANSAEAFKTYMEIHPNSHLIEAAGNAHAQAVKDGHLKTMNLCDQLARICPGMPFRMVDDIISPALPVIENTFSSAHGIYRTRHGAFQYRAGKLVACPTVRSVECPGNLLCHPGRWSMDLKACVGQ